MAGAIESCVLHEQSVKDISDLKEVQKDHAERLRDLELVSAKRDIQFSNLEKSLLEISKSQSDNKSMILTFEKEVRQTNEKLITTLGEKQDSMLKFFIERESEDVKYIYDDKKDARAVNSEDNKNRREFGYKVIIALLALASLAMGFKDPITNLFGGGK